MQFFLTFIVLIISIAATEQQVRQAECPIAQNPSQVFQCLTLNPQAFVDVISKNDFKSFCHMANGYMTCMSTYIRDCLGGKAASGILEELQDLNLKCCISPKVDECVIKNPILLQQCFSTKNTVTMSDGRKQPIMSIRPGDIVKAIDSSTGNLIDSEVVSILHKNAHKTTIFQVITDTLNKTSISLSPSHLIHINGVNYVQARKVKLGDTLRLFNGKGFEDVVVGSINFEIDYGFTAPLTNAGTILVNGVDSSCYAVVNNHHLANLGMFPVKAWYSISKFLFGEYNELDTYENLDFYSENLFKVASYLMPSYFS